MAKMTKGEHLFDFPDATLDPAIFVHASRAQEEKRKVQHNPLLARGRTIDRADSQLTVFRLWNSATPLYSDKLRSNGGGYFLTWRNHGVVIDPGFDFISQFGVRHSIDDIDVVIVTHDHPDHCEDLARIVTLLKEVNEGRANPHRVHFYLSYGTFFKHNFVFQNEEIAQYTIVEKVLPPCHRSLAQGDLSVRFTRTYHKEILGDDTGFGLRLNLEAAEGKPCEIGITGDTAFSPDLATAFEGVDLLIAHLGTLEDLHERALLSSHLGYRGILELVRRMSVCRRVLVSEWGEEVCGMRKAICESIKRYVPNTHILPTDLLMRIRLPQCDVYIEDDGAFVPFDGTYVDEDFGSKLVFKRR